MSVGADTLSSLSRLGIVVKRDWAVAAERVLREKGVAAKDLVDALVEQFLFADMCLIGQKSLPSHVDRMHDCRLTGSFVLQVQEVFNIGEALERRNKDTANTCLKLWLTDGHQRVVGFEYRKIAALKVEMPVGYKLAIHDVMVKRGILMLCPQTVCVLGGEVASLVKEQVKSRRELARRNQPYYIPGGGEDEDEEDPPQRASLESYLYGSRDSSASNGTAASSGLASRAVEIPQAKPPVPGKARIQASSDAVFEIEEDSFDDRDSSMSPLPVIRHPVQRIAPENKPQFLMEEDLESFPEDLLEAIDEDISMNESEKEYRSDTDVQMGACDALSGRIDDDELLELMEGAEKSDADFHSEDVAMADVEDDMDDLDFDFDFEKPSFKLLDLPAEDDKAANAGKVNYLVDVLASLAPFEGTVKAAIRNSVSMLSVDGTGSYTATVTLEDGTASCTAVLSSSVIQEHCLGGLAPQEYQRLKSTPTAEAKARLTEAGQLLERNLAQMEGMMSLSFNRGLPKEPCRVLELWRPSKDDLDALFAAAGIERRGSPQCPHPPRIERKASPARGRHRSLAPSPISIEDSPMQPRLKSALYCSSPKPSSPPSEESPIIISSPTSKARSHSPPQNTVRSRHIRRLIESDSEEELNHAVEDVLAGRSSSSSLIGSNEELSFSVCAEGHFDEAKDSCGVGVVFGPNHRFNLSKSFEGGGSTAKAGFLAIKAALERAPKNRSLVVYTYSGETVEAMNTQMQAWRRTGFPEPNTQLLKQIARLEDKFVHHPSYFLVNSAANSKIRSGA